MQRFMMSVPENMYNKLNEERELRGLDTIQITLRQIISEHLQKSEQAGTIYKGEVHEIRISSDETYLAIGEKETSQRAGIHFPIEHIFEPLTGRRIKLTIERLIE